MAIAYRVVREIENVYYSAMVDGYYRLEYHKGEITKAYPGSMGIMCFKRRHQAEKFKTANRSSGKIIRVRGKRGRVPKFSSGRYGEDDISYVCRLLAKHGWKLFSTMRLFHPAIEGTICYDEVKVL